jgi:sugar O-acyltransferase (sialic acid O-acetyltransferase NeuD family)
MNNSLAIIGSGVLGQHIAHYAKDSGEFSRIVFFDDTLPIGSENNFGKVIGKISQINEFIKANEMQNMLIGIGYKHMGARKIFYDQFVPLINFPNIIHKSCYVDKTTLIGNGNVILPGCIIDKDTTIGNNIFFNPGCIISHDNLIEDHTFFGPGVKTSGFVKIGSCCFLGTGTTIIDNISIKDHIKTGGGALITRDISEAGLYIGVPAKKSI